MSLGVGVPSTGLCRSARSLVEAAVDDAVAW